MPIDLREPMPPNPEQPYRFQVKPLFGNLPWEHEQHSNPKTSFTDFRSNLFSVKNDKKYEIWGTKQGKSRKDIYLPTRFSPLATPDSRSSLGTRSEKTNPYRFQVKPVFGKREGTVGRMSVVGPRPHPVAQDEQHRHQIKRYMSRNQVKPGSPDGLKSTAGGVRPTRSRKCKSGSNTIWIPGKLVPLPRPQNHLPHRLQGLPRGKRLLTFVNRCHRTQSTLTDFRSNHFSVICHRTMNSTRTSKPLLPISGQTTFR
jgi:hypothetical protein